MSRFFTFHKGRFEDKVLAIRFDANGTAWFIKEDLTQAYCTLYRIMDALAHVEKGLWIEVSEDRAYGRSTAPQTPADVW